MTSSTAEQPIYAGSTVALYLSLQDGATDEPITTTSLAEITFEVLEPGGAATTLTYSAGEVAPREDSPGEYIGSYLSQRSGAHRLKATATDALGHVVVAVEHFYVSGV